MAKRYTTADEIREPAAVYDAQPRVPPEACRLEGFRSWARSDGFPESGRIDFVEGGVEIEMSPEDLHTHGTVKTAIAAELFQRIARLGRGFVFADRTRVTLPVTQISVEPDVVVVLVSSLDQDRVRQIPAAAKGAGRFVELEGAPDLVVEILSDSSVKKDTERLPPCYASAGIGEMWLVDACGESLRFEIHLLDGTAFRVAEPDAAGRAFSPLLDARVGLTRRPMPHSGWLYQLEVG